MGREAAIGPISVFPNVRALAMQRASASYGGSISQYVRALIYADLFTHNLLTHMTEHICPVCQKVTKFAPVTYDNITLSQCTQCGATDA